MGLGVEISLSHRHVEKRWFSWVKQIQQSTAYTFTVASPRQYFTDTALSEINALIPSLQLFYPANTKRWPNVDFMLGHRLRRWPNMKSTLDQRLVFACVCVCKFVTCFHFSKPEETSEVNNRRRQSLTMTWPTVAFFFSRVLIRDVTRESFVMNVSLWLRLIDDVLVSHVL